MTKLFKSTLVTLMTIFVFLPISSAQQQAGIKVLTIQDDPILEAPLQIDVYLHGKKIKSDVPDLGAICRQ